MHPKYESHQDFAHQQLPFKRFGDDVSRLLKTLEDGTYEAKYLLSKECDLLYECKVCRSIFRSSVNYIDHKRNFCTDLYDYYMHVVNSYRSNSENVSLVPATSQSSEKSASKENKTNSSVEITNRQSKRKRQCNSQNSNSEVTVNVSIPNPALLIPLKPTQTVTPKPQPTVTPKPVQVIAQKSAQNIEITPKQAANNEMEESNDENEARLTLRSRKVERVAVEPVKQQKKQRAKRRKTINEIADEQTVNIQETVNVCLNEDIVSLSEESNGLADEQPAAINTERPSKDSETIEMAIDAYEQIKVLTSNIQSEAMYSMMIGSNKQQATTSVTNTGLVYTEVGSNEHLTTEFDAVDTDLIETAIDFNEELTSNKKPITTCNTQMGINFNEPQATTSANDTIISLDKFEDSLNFIEIQHIFENQISRASNSSSNLEQQTMQANIQQKIEDDSDDDVIILSDDDDDDHDNNMKNITPRKYRLTEPIKPLYAFKQSPGLTYNRFVQSRIHGDPFQDTSHQNDN